MNMLDIVRGTQRRVTQLEETSVRVRVGKVTDDSPLAVSIAGSTPYTGVKSIAGQTYAVNDLVAVAQWGSTMIVLGVIQ